jgi:hypothetical protein
MRESTGTLAAVAAAALMAALPSAATAAVVEAEPNDTLGSAQFVPNNHASFTISGARTFGNPSDDFFSFEVRSAGLLSILSSSGDAFADSIMGLFDPMGNLVASNDDAPGQGFMSGLDFLVSDTMVGTWTLGFSGFNPGLIACGVGVPQCYDTNGDFVFDTFVAGGGAGGSTGWDYSITLNGPGLVSAPPTLALAALGLALLLSGSRGTRGTPRIR